MTDPTAIDLGPVDDAGLRDPFRARIDAYAAHGNVPIRCPYVTKVNDTLYHGGIRHGLNLPEEIRHVVSLYKWAEYPVKNNNKVTSKLTVEMYDSTDQGLDQVWDIARWVNAARKTGPVLVHCQAGINRSSLVVATALFLNGEVNSGREAVDLLRDLRSPAVLCNPAFEQWVLNNLKED